MAQERIRVVIGVPMEADLRARIAAVDERVEVVYDESLFPWPREIGDHHGRPPAQRSDGERERFMQYAESAEVLFGIPELRVSGLKRVIQNSDTLRWLHCAQAGAGAIVLATKLPPEELQKVTVTTSAGVHAVPLAEFALFGMLAGAKNLALLQRRQAAHEWVDREPTGQLAGTHCLILGVGEIGKATARLAKAFGMTVTGMKRTVEDVEFVDEMLPIEQLGEAVGRADHVVITLPGTPHTEHLVDAGVLAKMKPGVNIVNVGRGSVIEESALVEALRSGHVASAALDVFEKEPLAADSPLWDMPQVIISPHTATLDHGEEYRVAELFIDNLRAYLDGKPMRNVVNIDYGY